jgi:hypothetical protein
MKMNLSEGSRQFWRQGDAWTAEEIHEAVKEFQPKFVILPPDFPPEVARLLFLSDPDIRRWPRYPKILYRGPHTNTFFLADYLYAEKSPERWNRILENMRATGDRGDQEAAEAIRRVLMDRSGMDPDARIDVKLAVPSDWLERVDRAEERLALQFE